MSENCHFRKVRESSLCVSRIVPGHFRSVSGRPGSVREDPGMLHRIFGNWAVWSISDMFGGVHASC